MFDNSKLKGRINEKFGGVPKFADALGVHQNVVYKKLWEISQIHRDDMLLWSKTLDIKFKEIPDYFLKIKSN